MKKTLLLTAVLAFTLLWGAAVETGGGITINHNAIKSADEYGDINIAVPDFAGFTGAGELTREIRDFTIDSIGYVRSTYYDLEEAKQNGADWRAALYTYYDYEKYDLMLSVRLNTYVYIGGAHGGTVITPFTINTSTGDIYSFKDLFNNPDEGTDYAESFILASMEKDPDAYFEDGAATVKDKCGNFDFYFENDELVVFFGQYEIAPYAGGIRYFRMNVNDDIKTLLKPEIYASAAKAQRGGLISFNGAPIGSKNKGMMTEDWISLIPLRAVAEALGYEVGWNRKDGAIVAGGFIKPGKDIYEKEGGASVRLSAPVVISGVTYVPIGYFTDVLDENVIADTNDSGDMEIKAFGKKGFQYGFYDRIGDFTFPTSEKDAVTMYAEACKERNGAKQYGLFVDALRKVKYAYLENVNFCTGVSSPWIDSYEITSIDKNTYKIDFKYKTSTGDEPQIGTAKLTVYRDGELWRISSIA